MSIGTAALDGTALYGLNGWTNGQTGTKNVSSSSIFSQTLQNEMRETSMDSIFEEAAERYDVPVSLLRAVAKAESGFNANAVSKSGAMGVMQLMPATAKSLGVTDPFDAKQNIMGGAKYLKENLDRFQNVELALAAYNAGPGSVQKYGGIPPYKETQNYVKKVVGYMGDTTLLANKNVTTGKTTSTSGTGTTSVSSEWSGISNLFLGGNNLLYSLVASGAVQDEDGNVVIDEESFANMIQLFRIQAMMEAGSEIGRMEIGEA